MSRGTGRVMRYLLLVGDLLEADRLQTGGLRGALE
jgi:hypothetical protein